nr:N-acyl homoserine lactonase family protein [uncultured Desulfobulbus sp.]
METYCIHPIVMGTKIFDKSMMTYQYGSGTPYTIPIYCWYLEGGDKTILVDTGEMSPIRSEEREKAIGGPIYTFEEGLAKWGLNPEDIDVVIHTHLHNDHCENDYKCINAKIYAHEKELASIHNPHPLDYRYNEEFLYEVEDNGQVEAIKEDCEILPGIRLVHTPAHTEGGMSIIINTAQGTAVITGFCIIKENLEPPIQVKAMEMEVIPPGTHVNVYQAYDIVKKIKSMGELILPLHEPSLASVESI